MQMVPVEKVLHVSSEHPDHTAFSLVTGFGQWKTELPGEEKAELSLRLSELIRIARVEVANESSAWLDIRVSREGTPFAALLPTICLQSRKESKEGDNARIRKTLEAKDFNEEHRQDKFDLVKIICRQPFNRSILFGLSHLKFFTYPPEDECKKQRPKSSSGIGRVQEEDEEVVLDIVHGSKENNRNGNEVAAIAIKKACIQDINREKRFVNTPLNDGDPDPDGEGGTLRAKSLLKHFTDSIASSTSTTSNVQRPPLTDRSPGVVKPAFVFAPKTSAAEQEARAKKAAAAADEIIPGRSPRKSRTSTIAMSSASTAKQTPTENSPAATNLTDDAEGDVDHRFLKDSLSRWKKDHVSNTPDGGVGASKSAPSSPVEASRKTPSSLASLRVRPSTVGRRLQDSGEEFNIEHETPRRVPPPKVSRASLPEFNSKSKVRAVKRMSVADGRASHRSDFGATRPPASKKAKMPTNILQRIFSSSEDESTPSSIANACESGSYNANSRATASPEKASRIHSAGHDASSDHTESSVSEDNEPQPGPSWRHDSPKKKSAKTGKSFRKSHVRRGREQSEGVTATDGDIQEPASDNGNEYEPKTSRNSAADATTASQPAVVKPEVHSDGEDLPIVMIKKEVIELDSDSAVEIESPKRNEQQQHLQSKKQTHRTPPAVNCEVESDSDLEVVCNDLMRGVVFALSGFKNPYRSSLRSMAIAMGAKYRPDWDESCTHLVCAFRNTPKYNEVRRKGGRIVTAAWIATSHLKNKLADWKNYRLS